MADTIKIQLDDIYQPITEEDIQKGKNFVLRRERTANALSYLVDGLLEDAAEQIVRIAYKYGIDPNKFQISPNYNETMFKEVSDVLDQLEDEILDLTLTYSTKCTESKDKKELLLLWLATLGKNNRDLKQTLEDRLWMFSRDLEAMIAVAKTAKLETTRAITVIKSNIHTAYQMPGMTAAFKNASLYKATYIRSRGVKPYNQGSSNSEANNIVRFAKMTVQLGWMHYLKERYEEQDAAGYWVGRGSNFPCEKVCDLKVGWHDISDKDGFPPFHAHCCCWAVPVYEKDMADMLK